MISTIGSAVSAVIRNRKRPNLDRLAKSGVRFTNAHCPAPSCNPSRSAIFTGVPPYRSGLYHSMQKLRDVMPRAEPLPPHFSRHGYWSAGSGKLPHDTSC